MVFVLWLMSYCILMKDFIITGIHHQLTWCKWFIVTHLYSNQSMNLLLLTYFISHFSLKTDPVIVFGFNLSGVGHRSFISVLYQNECNGLRPWQQTTKIGSENMRLLLNVSVHSRPDYFMACYKLQSV